MAVGTTAFPAALDTAVELVELTNNASSTLTSGISAGDTTITVDDPAEFPTTGFGTLVDDLDSPTTIEIISWTGKSGSDLTGVTRGAQGTSAAAFSAGEFIEVRPTKGHHEALRGAVIAVETKLGSGSSTSTANTVLLGNGTGTSAWGAITNAYIDASAAIALSKLAAVTASRALVSDASGFVSASSVTATELGYLSGVTSAIQTQLGNKQGLDATLTALAAYNTNGLLTQTAADTFTGRTITGTSDKIDVSNGDGVSGNPTLTIAATYVGQTSITTLGTVTTGTLSTGAVVGGVTLTLGSDGTGDVYYRSAGGVLTRLAIGSEDQVLTVSSGGLPEWAAVAGTGDVVGPASATDNAVARFNLTTGKLIQDSVVTIADTTGNMAGVGTLNAHTIPGGTDTFALLAATQTFTNKTLTAPDINGGTADALTSLGIRSTGSGAFDLTFANTENLAAGRTLTFTVNDAARTIDLAGNLTLAAAFTTSGANALTLTTTGATNVTLPTSGTLVNSGVTSLSSLTTVGTITTGGLGTGAVIGGVTMTLGSDGTGDIYYRSAGGVLTRLAAGTDGHVLTLASGLPSWAAASGGGGLTVGTTAIASGTAGRILYEASGNVLGEAAGITYQTGASPSTTITAQAASYVGLRVNSASTPSTDVFQVSADNGTTTHFKVTSTGSPSSPIPSYSGSERYGASITYSPTTGGNEVVIGNGISVTGTGDHSDCVVIGQGITKAGTSNSYDCVVIGKGALVGNGSNPYNLSVLIGHGARISYTASSNKPAYESVGVGAAVLLQGFRSVAVGAGASIDGTSIESIVAIGYGATVSASSSVAIGASATTSSNAASIALGRSATNTAANQMVIGSSSYPISDIYMGKGVTNATPTAYTINGTGGSGTNIAGADLQLAGGKGTGTGAAGKVSIQTAPAGTSGSSLNTLVTALQVDADTTAGNTRLLIYDVDNATLERVSVGAADSGGSGFKVLRIPN